MANAKLNEGVDVWNVWVEEQGESYRANLGGAIFYETGLANTDLSDAKGLDEIRHEGPSNFDHRTIHKTSPPLTELFLRGCGLPELSIDYNPTLLNWPIQFYSCFISYSHDNKDFATRLHDKVRRRKALNSAWVEDELDKAISEEIRIRKERNKRVLKIIPLNLDDHMFSNDYNDGVKSILTSRLALNFTGWENDDAKFNASYEQIKEALSLLRPPEPQL